MSDTDPCYILAKHVDRPKYFLISVRICPSFTHQLISEPLDLRSPHFGGPRYLSAPFLASQDLKRSIEFISDLYCRHDSDPVLSLKSSNYFRLVLVSQTRFVFCSFKSMYTSCGWITIDVSATQLPALQILQNMLLYMIGFIPLFSLRLTLIVEMGPPDKTLIFWKKCRLWAYSWIRPPVQTHDGDMISMAAAPRIHE